ncbi:MAG: hypothetical protein ACREBZ_04515 [Thermoplasmata archaeon]
MDDRSKLPVARRGTEWLRAGGVFGLAGGILAIALPFLFLWLAKNEPGGFFTFAASFLQFTSLLVLVGAVLVLISFFCYRWSYSLLRQASARFWVASALCLVGSSGLILIIIAAALASGQSNALVTCAQGSLSHAFSCVQSASPASAYAGLLGFWLGWIGLVGIVLGLFLSAGTFRSTLYGAGGALYSILVILLVAPFIATLYPVPFISGLTLAVPIAAVLAPLLVALAIPSRPTVTPPARGSR